GSGHGVGLCVIGSARLAEQGSSAGAILARYFPGLPIGLVSATAQRGARVVPEQPLARARAVPDTPAARPRAVSEPTPAPATVPLAISLPDGDEGERDSIYKLALRARDDLAGRLGIPPPPMMTLRFHPTTDDYEHATGQAWFTSGALVNG